jgi:GNAT superfamily N-acetyltransferase
MFAHDREAVDTWFWNGFGHRCVDAIRPLTPVIAGKLPEYSIRRITSADVDLILPIEREHSKYYSQSPMFMCVFRLPERKELADWLSQENNYLWAAFDGDRPVAYMKVTSGGETFVSDDPEMLNICSAYSIESVRGTGVGALLLSHIIQWLSENGYKRCGADFESFNRYGSRFWLKHFEPFTYSLFRRLDERILWANASRFEDVVF